MPPTNRDAILSGLQAEFDIVDPYRDELARAIACFTGGEVPERPSKTHGRKSPTKLDVETALFSLLRDNPLGIEKESIVDLVTGKIKDDCGKDGKGVGKFMKNLLKDPRVTLGADENYRLSGEV